MWPYNNEESDWLNGTTDEFWIVFEGSRPRPFTPIRLTKLKAKRERELLSRQQHQPGGYNDV